jgi:hypothetical protein
MLRLPALSCLPAQPVEVGWGCGLGFGLLDGSLGFSVGLDELGVGHFGFGLAEGLFCPGVAVALPVGLPGVLLGLGVFLPGSVSVSSTTTCKGTVPESSSAKDGLM